MSEKPVVMMESEEAAKLQTVTGWVSRLGHFFGASESTARYDGCTHRKCESCVAIIEKNRILCPTCEEKTRLIKFEKMEKREWDGKAPLVIFDTDHFFFDVEDLELYCTDHNIKPQALPLVFCKPIKPPHQDANDMFCDYLPGDQDVEDEDILAAIEALNKAIEKAEPFSWEQGNVAAIIPEDII